MLATFKNIFLSTNEYVEVEGIYNNNDIVFRFKQQSFHLK